MLEYIAKGREEGARLLVGGGVPEHLPKGFFVEPTILADVDPDSAVAQEEIFGPVLCVIPYDDDDDAVTIPLCNPTSRCSSHPSRPPLGGASASTTS